MGRTFTRLTRVSLVTRVWRRFFGALFGLKHGKISRKPPERALFFCAKVGLRKTLVIVPSDLNASPGPEGSLEIEKKIAMRFLNASVLERKALNRNLSWCFPLGNLLPKTRVLKHRVLERKRRLNANASILGTQRFRTLST